MRNVLAIETNHARGRFDELGQQIKAGGFARPIGADQGMDRTTPHIQIHPIHRHKTFEFFTEFLGLKNEISHAYILTLIPVRCSGANPEAIGVQKRGIAMKKPRRMPRFLL